MLLEKGVIKYGKINGITPMKTHVDNVHLHLISKRNSILSERALAKFFEIDHKRQHGKKRVWAIGSTIISFFGSTNLYKNVNETQQRFIENLVLYICKGYKPLSTCENIWLRRLISCECPRIIFLSCSFLVE
jgi:hypothetical protein